LKKISVSILSACNVLISPLGKAAKMLGDDYEVAIAEAHHRFKKDAPSDTVQNRAVP